MDVIHDKGKGKGTASKLEDHDEQHAAPANRAEERREDEDKREEEAAIVVQRAWRHHSMKKRQLTSDARWKDTLVQTKKQVLQEAAETNDQNDVKSRWKRGVFLAGMLQDGDAVMGTNGDGGNDRHVDGAKESPIHTKSLETQHWLELVDPKHRYGSNLKWYHQKWTEADTADNFFRWLDRGEGKDVTLPECNRKQLESERIIYLSAEQRLNYLITIDADGKIRWKRNSQYVDTTPGMWVDAGEGRGIVRADGTDVVHIRPRQESTLSDEEQTAKHYQGATNDQNLNAFQRVWKDRFTTKGLMERLLRKTVRKNTWLYVSDKNYNVFVGLKETGYFQHSSLTAGGLVTSAGLIEVNDGLVTNLSPLSGHYRTSIEHFKQFVNAMDERGLDIHKVHMTKGEAMLWGLEHWKGFQKANKERKKQIKHAAHVAVHPKIAHEEKEKETEKAAEEEKTRRKYEDARHAKAMATTSSSLTAQDVKDKALREKIEKMRKKKEQEDEQWKSGSQWRWEIITGRAQEAMKKQEEKWKSAMDSALSPSSKPTGDPVVKEEDREDIAPEAPKEGKEGIQSEAMKHSDSGYTSASAAGIPARMQSHPHELESGGARVDPVPEKASPGTPQDRPPAYDASEAANPPAEKSTPQT